MGFNPCKMKPDILLRPCEEDHYECVSFCTDNLLIASNDQEVIIDVLTLNLNENGLFHIILDVTLAMMMIALYILQLKSSSRQWSIATTTCFALNPSSTSHLL